MHNGRVFIGKKLQINLELEHIKRIGVYLRSFAVPVRPRMNANAKS
jgi:hypothetical protein